MRVTPQYTFFYTSKEVFSNWYEASFYEGINWFRTAEHYIMWRKAKLFGDDEMAVRILAAPTPRKAKALGREVQGFNQSEWEVMAPKIMRDAAWLKFAPGRAEYEPLLNTRGTLLVEASPTDQIWGVGLAEDDPRILDPTQWRGTNWLGQALTDVRDKLLQREWFDKPTPTPDWI